MTRKIMVVGLLLLFTLYIPGVCVFAVDEKGLEKQSNLIAMLLVSCRAIIAQNQDLINDSEIGDKGFTGDVYISKVKEHYKNLTVIEISESDLSSSDIEKKALAVLLISTKEVINEYQKVINKKGVGFKNVIPAIVGRRTGYKFTNRMGTGYYLKQTSIKHRNPANHPDTFETKALKKFEESGYQKGKGIGEAVAYFNGLRAYRYMLPVYIEPSCLKCHGDPKGKRDISGGIKEGYKEGELRGAISVMIPYPSE